MGNCLLFIDTLPIAFNIDVKGFKQREISTPNNEIIIKGPQEAFVENIRTNTSLLRRMINNENLIIENIKVGSLSKTNCAICYIQNIANTDLVAEVKYRISNLEIDSLLSSGELEQLIEEDNKYSIPQILSTERPDKATKYLYGGRVVVLIGGNPYALIMPATFIDFIVSPEDTNLKFQFANFLKFLRLIAIFITLFLPAFYVAITCFHQELLPTELLFSLLASRESVPFPIIFEILIMEISFELIREAGLRVPSPLGPTIGIVGALVIGQAAVSASIVSPILVIVVAITAVASFAIPDFSFGFHLRLMRFLFIILGYIAGFFGIALGIFVYLCILTSLSSFGVPYMAPYAPVTKINESGYFLDPVWRREQRADYLNTKKKQAQNHISMKWKYK
ncbi:MAG: spore germination protein [Clostridia bacterium]|jgi:spore germination protein KA|nr:spore germination protein [Clostridia bacterium]